MKIPHRINTGKIILLILLFYGAIYSLISIVNHYNFRTYACDLGIFNNALYDYAHFRFNSCTIIEPPIKNILGDHFDLLIPFFSPFIFIFGTWTLLVIQIAAILFGGIGVYKYIFTIQNDSKLAILAMIHFCSLFGIYSALTFDYHSNVVAAMLVPWFMFYFRKENILASIIFFLLIVIAKENMSLWMVFICVAMFFQYPEKRQRRALFVFSSAALLFFIAEVKFIMPALSPEGYRHFQYTSLGNNFNEISSNVFLHPSKIFNLLFLNTIGGKDFDFLKIELHGMLLFSGVCLLFFRPLFLVMLIPIYAQKLFNDDPLKWGINGHYVVEFVPIISLGAFSFIASMKNEKIKGWLPYALIASTAIASLHTCNHTYAWFDRTRQRIYERDHYQRGFNSAMMQRDLDKIPKEAKVSAVNALVSHLALRDTIYLFPRIDDADYVALLRDESDNYPISKAEYDQKLSEMENSAEWEKIFDANKLVIFQRRKIST